MAFTNVELMEWGTKEAAVRKAELADFHDGNLDLEEVQARAVRRRKEAGVSRSDATYAVIEATRRRS